MMVHCLQVGSWTNKVVVVGVATGVSLLLLAAATHQGKLLSPWKYLQGFWQQVRASPNVRARCFDAGHCVHSIDNSR